MSIPVLSSLTHPPQSWTDETVSIFVITLLLLLNTITDLLHRQILLSLTAAGAVFGLARSIVTGRSAMDLIPALFPGLFLLAFSFLTASVSAKTDAIRCQNSAAASVIGRRDSAAVSSIGCGDSAAVSSIGCGDGIVITALGLFLAPVMILSLCALAFLIAAVPAGFLLIRRHRRNESMPFMPFLLAAWIILLVTSAL